MDTQNFYRAPDPQLCQGDILRAIPSIHLKAPLEVLQKTNIKGGTMAYLLSSYDSGTFRKDGELVIANCQVTRAIILSHSCDIDNDPKHRLVALIRPLKP